MYSHRFHEKENQRGGVRALSERNAYNLRALQLGANVSDTKLNACLANAFLYFTRQVIPKGLMWGSGTLSAVKHRIEWYEERRQGEKIRQMVDKHPRMAVFLSTDDSGGRHAISTAYPHITDDGTRTVLRELLTVSHYVKKQQQHHAALNKETLEKYGYPVENIAGGNTDHPAETEIRLTVELCHDNTNWISRWLGCGNHKTALICKWISSVMCKDKAMHEFSHKQFGFLYRYPCIHIHAFIHPRIHICMLAYIYMHKHIHMHACMHAFIHMRIYITCIYKVRVRRRQKQQR